MAKLFKKRKKSGEMVAFVLIKCSPHHEHEVYNNLIKADYVKEVHPLFGEYDLIVKVRLKDWNQIEDIVLNRIRAIKGIILTETLTGTRF